MNQTIKRFLDATGLLCPEPVMMLHKAVKEVDEGDLIEVTATDPSTKRDIPKFCSFLGHELVSHSETEKEYKFVIRKNKK